MQCCGAVGILIGAVLLSPLALAGAFSRDTLPPKEIHFCDAECAALYLTTDGLGYSNLQNVASPTRDSPHGIWIDRFDATGILLTRHDPPNQIFPRGLRGTITGRIADDGNQMVDGKTTWTYGISTSYDAQITWGPLLDSLPSAGQAPGGQAAQAYQKIQTAIENERAATNSASSNVSSVDTAVFGEFDLHAYRDELARSKFTISKVRAAEYHERIKGNDVAHIVLIVDSFFDDYSKPLVSTGVRDYLVHKADDHSRMYGPQDIVNRNIICSNGVVIRGGIDGENIFHLDVQVQTGANAEAGTSGRDRWHPTLNELAQITSSLTRDPANFRDVAMKSIALNSHRYPDPAFVPNLGPGRGYVGAFEKSTLIAPGASQGDADMTPQQQELLDKVQGALDKLKAQTGGEHQQESGDGVIRRSNNGDGVIRRNNKSDGVIRKQQR